MKFPASTQSLSPLVRRRTSAWMTNQPFDEGLGELRRRRAMIRGPELFLHERAFEDILDRLSLIQRRFRSALLVSGFDPGWSDKLKAHTDTVNVIDPRDIGGIEPDAYDLCVAIGWLDTANDLPSALLTLRFALRGDSLILGALSGGDTLPTLRSAMRVADERMGGASPHAHPRVEPAPLTALLSSTGFTMPVVDVDRVRVSYKALQDLVRDLRSMGATNILASRSRKPFSRAAADAAASHFQSLAKDGRATEKFEILHFAAWTPPSTDNG